MGEVVATGWDVSEFLTTKEVADLLRLKERKIYELAKTNAIPVSRVTGKLLFPRDMVEAWVRRATEFAGGADALVPPPLVLAGSHDPLLDWALRESGGGIATYFDGSLDGLKRVAAGEAVAAGMHVPEDDPPGWNSRHVEEAMPGQPVVLIEWARRRQGLILRPGEETGVRSVGDLKGRTIMPRQPTAGSRILLSRLIVAEGLNEADFDLLDPPARSQTDVAVAVADGKADAGLAIETAARQMRLAFVPLAEERYDILVWRRAYFEPPFQALLAFARSQAFAARAAEIGGYDTAGFGTVHYNGA